MNILDLLNNKDQGQLISQFASKFNVDQSQIQNIMQTVLPALSRGMKQNVGSAANQQKFLQALQNGDHARYVENPEEITKQKTIQDGNKILGHVLGNKQNSREVAARAAKQTGADKSMIKKMLPMLAAAAMGILSKQSSSSNASALQAGDQSSNSIMTVVQSVLDADNDGSIVDDLFDAASGFFDNK